MYITTLLPDGDTTVLFIDTKGYAYSQVHITNYVQTARILPFAPTGQQQASGVFV